MHVINYWYISYGNEAWLSTCFLISVRYPNIGHTFIVNILNSHPFNRVRNMRGKLAGQKIGLRDIRCVRKTMKLRVLHFLFTRFLYTYTVSILYREIYKQNCLAVIAITINFLIADLDHHQFLITDLDHQFTISFWSPISISEDDRGHDQTVLAIFFFHLVVKDAIFNIMPFSFPT